MYPSDRVCIMHSMTNTTHHTTARTTYRNVESLTDALEGLARFHADPFDPLTHEASELAAVAAEGIMPRDEAEAIITAHELDVAERRAAGTYKGGRTPKPVLEARAALEGKAYVDPRKGRAMKDIQTMPTEDVQMPVPGGDVERFAENLRQMARSAKALAVRESRIARLDDPRAEVVLAANAREAENVYQAVRRMWPEGAEVWDTVGHLSGEDAAQRNNDGTHHTASRKGNATTIRYGNGEARSTNKRHTSGSMHDIHALDEDALLEAIASVE